MGVATVDGMTPEYPAIVASVAGAAAGALQNRSSDSLKRKTCEALTGALTGIFIGPAIATTAAITDEHIRAGLYFGVGLCGVLLVSMFLEFVKGGGLKAWIAKILSK